jgi:glycerate kinase
MKFLIAPDKFKGSIDSISLCSIIRKEILFLYPDAVVDSYPLADGGDGFADIIRYYFNTSEVNVETVDPIGRPIVAAYQMDKNNSMVFIEMASASGLVLLKEHEKDPMRSSSYGTGLMIKHAIQQGAKKILLGIGGSATNDAGMGMASALGYLFIDENQEPLDPCGENLLYIHEIINPEKNLLEGVEVQVACDVNNPLFGPNGAAYVYASQKGANAQQVELLDNGLRNINDVFKKHTGINIAELPGAGAAGGMGAGASIFLNATLIPGVEYIIESIGLEEKIIQAEHIITGEGGFDEQSLQGKVVGHIAELAKKHGKKISIICGISSITESRSSELGIDRIISIAELAPTNEDSINRPKDFLPEAVRLLF